MLSSNRSRAKRRGIVLVLVLAMLGLLALVGITFATFSGQARINNRNFMLSLFQPQADELIDFGLAQLITDTNNINSVLRGHSMAADMFGSDALFNGYLPQNPTTGGPFYITNVTQVGNFYNLTTNIQVGDPNFYGFNFNRWIIKVAYTGALVGTQTAAGATLPPIQPANQTFEILADITAGGPGTARIFQIAVPDIATNLINPTLAAAALPGTAIPFSSQLPGQYLHAAVLNPPAGGLGLTFPFTLDGRWLHAFNGAGMGAFTSPTTGVNATYYPNFRYNGAVGPNGQPGLLVPGPGQLGMDEDYDACDLENWFLAIQSADGQVMIPSFHRPGIIRVDPNGVGGAIVNDWTRVNNSNPNGGGQLWADSAARFLRPCQADGHDAATFPDLVPDTNTGQIPYDVDNDGDGVPDSVWLDLGYPVRRDSSGRNYKPLFAFMVIGLNGRIPLNTAGNLAAQVQGIYIPPTDGALMPPPPRLQGGPGHAVHLGNSISEVDPTYALQNAFIAGVPGNPVDALGAFAPPGYVVPNSSAASNTQVDIGGIDVRLTQFRNLLAGTRPQPTPLNNNFAQTDPNGNINGDRDFVLYTGSVPNTQYFMPNGIAELGIDATNPDANTGLPFLVRSNPPVPGRWGEAQSVPGTPFPNPLAQANPALPAVINVVGGAVGLNYANPVRSGYSLSIRDIMNGLPPDAADDNFNTYDPMPIGHLGEVNDLDVYDAVGALVFPVDRMRRWLSPADINGTGQLFAWNPGSKGVNHGFDALGRVEFNSYFRPPGSPGVISTNGSVVGGVFTSTDGSTLGAIYFPTNPPPALADPFYTSTPANIPPAQLAPAVAYPTYLPDLTNNPLHAFETFRFPNQAYDNNPQAPAPNANGIAAFTPQRIGGLPVDLNLDMGNMGASNVPTVYPTYDFAVNATIHSDGLNDADETNLYQPNPLLDSPFGPTDLEWLYRQQDVDGASLSSRLAQLAPISLTNGLDGQRRRRLFSLDSWDLNNFVWTNDNPGNAFPTNSRFALRNPVPPLPPLRDPANGQIADITSPSFASLSAINNVILSSPSLAQRDKKINLNYPLPVSNDPNEPVRQKWISETYQLLKLVLPPKAVDTPEELAQLSQYVINIIDFRDPDGTMTHWQNPDVLLAGVPIVPAILPPPTTPVVPAPPTLIFSNAAVPVTTPPSTTIPLDQYGMEYNPVALNEVLAFSYQYLAGGVKKRANRFFVELVNTLTSPEQSSTSTFNPALNLGGLLPYQVPDPIPDPYSAASWDIVFTADDPYSRPDPYRGQLLPYANTYGMTPLNMDAFGSGSGVILTPLGQASSIPAPPVPQTMPPTDYFYAIGNAPPSAANEVGTPLPTTQWPQGTVPGGQNPAAGINTYYTTAANPPNPPPSLVQTLLPMFDPINGTNGPPLPASPMQLYQGVFPPNSPPGVFPPILQSWNVPPPGNPNPQTAALPTNYMTSLPLFAVAAPNQTPAYYWACLRRPANPFAPVSATNPMVVVDSVRFPYIDGTPVFAAGATSSDGLAMPANAGARPPGNYAYSIQRFQPYRGGHAVPVTPPSTWVPPAGVTPMTSIPIDPRYGYTEQIVAPTTNSQLMGTEGIYYKDPTNQIFYSTPIIYHTLGWANEYEQGSNSTEAEPWDYLPFNDRDFTSVAELLLVPGCSPGLFTKQFVEFAPSFANVWNIFAAVIPLGTQVIPPPPTIPTYPLQTYSNPPIGTVPVATSILCGPLGQQPVVGQITGPPAATTTIGLVQPFTSASMPFAYATNGIAAPTGSVEPHSYPYLNDEFFYTGFGGAVTIDPGLQVGGYAADGWSKMFEFFEVPSQMIGAIGPVAQGANFDWLRQDIKPGQLNPNLIIDEEVFMSLTGQQKITQSNVQITDSGGMNVLVPSNQFSQQLLNFNQIPPLAQGNYTVGANVPLPLPLPLGASPIPMVVTSTLANGSAGTAYPIAVTPSATGGVVDQDPTYNAILLTSNNQANGPPPIYSNGLKASWVQFLTARHGGSGYIFGFGTGGVGQNFAVTPVTPPQAAPANYGTGIPAERPFHSLSYPDIDYTIMRPAALPPSVFTNPAYSGVANTYTAGPPATVSTYYAGDPGVRNPTLYLPYPTGTFPGTLPTGFGGVGTQTTPWGPTFDPAYPAPIPTRRLFQVPDSFTGGSTAAFAIYSGASNASETGDPYLNNQIPVNNATGTLVTIPALPNPQIPGVPPYVVANAPWSSPGAVPPFAYTLSPTAPATDSEILTNSVVNLYWPGANAATIIDTTTGTTTPVTFAGGYPGGSNPYMGTSAIDYRQHPYWRSEQLQRVMNLTTVRTHQYAVWITIGFFEVKRQGDQMMVAFNPQLAFDILGPEIGAANGKSTRYRGFYLVDRLKLTGFNPSNPTAFRSAVVYRQRIQ